MSTAQKPDPSKRGAAQIKNQRATEMCRDIFEGPLKIREKRTTYLPQFPKEPDQAYSDRLAQSVFYDAFSRTIFGLTGLIFRDPAELHAKLPQDIFDIWENIDLQNTHGDVFIQESHEDGEVDGVFVIFVDMQEFDPESITNRYEEEKANRRPYWIRIKKENICGARTTIVNGKPVLSHFRYKTCDVKLNELYDEVEIEKVREYNLELSPFQSGTNRVAYKVWSKAKKDQEWVLDKDGYMNGIDEIPVSVAYHGKRDDVMEARPPHLPLALENIKHYQLVSDNDNILHLCACPVFVRIGVIGSVDGEEVIPTGPTVGVDVPIGGDVKYASPDAGALDSFAKRIEKSEQRMSLLGLSMLMSETREPETATSKRINKAESDSALAKHARASQDAFEEAIRLTAKWLGIQNQLPVRDRTSRWIHINKNFGDLTLDPQMATILKDMVVAGKLRQETLWAILERHKVLPDTFNAEEEATLLEEKAMDDLKKQVEVFQAQGQAASEEGDKKKPPVKEEE